MAHVIAIANQKGGVGKSKISSCTAGSLAEVGRKVLLVDMDQQGNLTATFLDEIHKINPTVNDLLVDEPGLKTIEVIKPTHIEGISVLPANLSLAHLDSRTAGDQDAQDYLADALESVRHNYDFIIIDCPPSLGVATRMALVAASGVIIPVECQDYAVSGTQQIIHFIKKIKKKANPNLTVIGFVINKFTSTRAIERKYNELLRAEYQNTVFKTEFMDHVEYTHVPMRQLPITHLLPKSRQANAYRSFTQELFERLN